MALPSELPKCLTIAASGDDSGSKNDDEAAVRLQAAYRGYQCRRDVQGMQNTQMAEEENMADDDEAAIRLQAAYRGYRARSLSGAEVDPANIGTERLSISARLEKQREACQGIAATNDAEATKQVTIDLPK